MTIKSLATDSQELPPPAAYFPPADGHYRVRPDLHPLGRDFGNGDADRRILQLDRQWGQYRQQKNVCRAEDPYKYICSAGLTGEQEQSLARHLLALMQQDYPHWFSCRRQGGDYLLDCRASGDRLRLDSQYRLLEMIPGAAGGTVALNTLDALACQLQEDLSLISGEDDGRLCWLHLCFPNRWAARDKIGRDFVSVHAPVPHMEEINRRSSQLLRAMINKGPFVRFAWGITDSPALNLHPQGGATVPLPRQQPSWYLRVERQTISGLPNINSSLFTIRTYIYPLQDIRRRPAQAEALARALQGMSGESRHYKGLSNTNADIIAWLRAQPD